MNNRDPLRFKAELEQHLRDGTVEPSPTTPPRTAAALLAQWRPHIAAARANDYEDGAQMLEDLCAALEKQPAQRMCQWQTFSTMGDTVPRTYQLATVAESGEWIGLLRNPSGLSGTLKSHPDGTFSIEARDPHRYARTWPDEIDAFLMLDADQWGEPPDAVPIVVEVLSREKDNVRLRIAHPEACSGRWINVKAYAERSR